jgi:hypothetical protein
VSQFKLVTQMGECVVCQYWSERLKETRIRGGSEGALKQEGRLMAALQAHQLGACASRFPDILKGLLIREVASPDTARAHCDPAHARILTNRGSDEFETVVTYDWQ